jgi:hypothetical protein
MPEKAPAAEEENAAEVAIAEAVAASVPQAEGQPGATASSITTSGEGPAASDMEP